MRLSKNTNCVVTVITTLLAWIIVFLSFQSTKALSSSSRSYVYDILCKVPVKDSRTGSDCTVLQGYGDSDSDGGSDYGNGNYPGKKKNKKKLSLVVILPQLGEFDSAEFCEQLVAAYPAFDGDGDGDDDDNANSDFQFKGSSSSGGNSSIDLKVVGIGETKCAKLFSEFTGLPMDCLMIDPSADLHKALDLHAGPGWDVPTSISDEVLTLILNTLPGGAPVADDNDEKPSLLRSTAKAWLNYLAMCAGIGAPGTLPEIFRGYIGDMTAPERFAEHDVVKAGPIEIGPGVGPVKLGPFRYSQWFADERGYQRPVELATVRLKNMVEVLTKWDDYVTNPTKIDRRGATYLLDNTSGQLLYEYKHRGVLTYSETMSRPLTFLSPYIGEKIARNPLGLPDYSKEEHLKRQSGRGILKPAGKFMSLLKPIFALENKLQAQLLGAEATDFEMARKTIQETIGSNHVVIYTYGLSPFSSQAISLLEKAGCVDYKKIELGLEWFLLGREESAIRAELLDMTGQSSLPHIFIGGKHIGGLFSGTSDSSPGLAALQESGELDDLLTKTVSNTVGQKATLDAVIATKTNVS